MSYNKQKHTVVFIWKDSEPSLKLLTVTLMQNNKNHWTFCRPKTSSLCVCAQTALCVCWHGYLAPYLSFYWHAPTFTPSYWGTSIIIHKFHSWCYFPEASVDTHRNCIFTATATCDGVRRYKIMRSIKQSLCLGNAGVNWIFILYPSIRTCHTLVRWLQPAPRAHGRE